MTVTRQRCRRLGEEVDLFLHDLQEIRALIVFAPGAAVSADQVFEHCRGLLADFKVPRYVEFRTTLPRSSNFKIRRDELIASADPTSWFDRHGPDPAP